jgi:hypothetical protein
MLMSARETPTNGTMPRGWPRGWASGGPKATELNKSPMHVMTSKTINIPVNICRQNHAGYVEALPGDLVFVRVSPQTLESAGSKANNTPY